MARRKPQLFGTDGVRGVAGSYPLDGKTVAKLGAALGAILAAEVASQPEVLLGIDTRESGPWLAETLAAGLRSSGATVAYAGIVTTPAVAFLTRKRGFSAGVMVSASHNPFHDNGIKIFSAEGAKPPERMELEIERAIESAPVPATGSAPLRVMPGLIEEYLGFLESLAPPDGSISNLRLVVDCANGSACAVAPGFFERIGVRAKLISTEPDGRNINLNCGSLHPETMARETQAADADLGVAFDGDADRAIFASRSGRILDGDHVLFAMAPYLSSKSLLKGGVVVGTLMTNLGLELALGSFGIGLKRTPVGDKFVLEEMLHSGANLGGEPSGHLIFRDVSPTGDGFVSLIEMLRLISATGKPADELVRNYTPFPQLIRNVAVRKKTPLESLPEVAAALARCQNELDGRGRVVLRYSGTEPLVRIMVEGERASLVERHAAQIASVIEENLGKRSPRSSAVAEQELYE